VLNDRDRRTLADMERELRTSDPDLVRWFEFASVCAACSSRRAGQAEAGSRNGTPGNRRAQGSRRVRRYLGMLLGLLLVMVLVSALLTAPFLGLCGVLLAGSGLALRAGRWERGSG
jgi:hypothetical protein